MSTEHSEHNHLNFTAIKPLKTALIIVIVVMVAEVVGGMLSNSVALLSDAGHMLADALALGLSLFALTIAKRPATPTKTYGYHRAEIMAALANGVILILISIYIFYEAYQRFLEPPVLRTPIMLIVAGVGLVANIFGILLLKRDSHGNLNIKSAYWHIMGDTISSVGVIVGGIIILVTGWYIVDPIIAVIIGCIILWGAVRIVKEAADILLESVPKHIDINEVISTVKKIPGVVDMHEVHSWTITSGIYAISAHLRIEDQTVSMASEIVETVNQYLAKNYNITHTTLQLECDTCPTGLVCNLP